MSYGPVSRCTLAWAHTCSGCKILNKCVHYSDLMAKDDFKNLGFHNAAEDSASNKAASGSDAQGKAA